MSSKALDEAERASLNLILEDLRYLFDKQEILQDEIDDVLQKLRSEEVKSYIQNLRYGSKPETALRESFIAGKSILLKYLFGEAAPEVRSNGFLDYLIKDEMGRGIALELKPLFEAVTKPDKAGKPILERLKQKKLRPESYRDQILKYIRKGEVQFVILTDLKDWFFYSKELTPREFKHFCAIGFFDFIEEYEVIGNLRDYLERKEFESIRYELDKWFLESLKAWVKKLSEVDFTVDDKRKLQLIIGLINKFIFVQTLDDYGVIEFNWIRKRWNYHEQMWQRKGKLMVLKKFFAELDDWFFLYYDTELFREKILQYVTKENENIDKLYKNLQLVLGLTYLQVPFGALKGIMQYNFRYIDEDIFGKAYETYLAGVRHDEGIYYTPKFVTKYVAENTVGEKLDEIVKEIREELEKENFEEVREALIEFTSVRVLDPACGSGSFLIKAVRKIMEKYKEVQNLLQEAERKHNKWQGRLHRPKEIEEKVEKIHQAMEILGPRNDRELIARMLVRHIHGSDKDKKALDVAKVNIWLEAIKLSPAEFRYDRLPAETNYILPDLQMNLCSGDSLVGLPEPETIEYLATNQQKELEELCKLRNRYIENPNNPELVEKIVEIKKKLREKLDLYFKKYLDKHKLPVEVIKETIPFHWALDYWYFYFDHNGHQLSSRKQGTDIVIGNPPYERIQVLNKKSPIYVKYLNETNFTSTTGNYDLASVFIEKGFRLLNSTGEFGYIVTNKFIEANYGEGIRKVISQSKALRELVNFGDEQIFEKKASTYTCLLFLSRIQQKEFKYAQVKRLIKPSRQLSIINDRNSYEDSTLAVEIKTSDILSQKPWVIAVGAVGDIVSKLLSVEPKLGDLTERISQGFLTSADSVYIVKHVKSQNSLTRVFSKQVAEKIDLETELLKPLIKGKEMRQYEIRYSGRLAIFPYQRDGDKFKLIPEEVLTREYPRVHSYFKRFEDLLRKRERGKWDLDDRWYSFSRPQNLDLFPKQKILTPFNAFGASFCYDDHGFYFTAGIAGGYGITLKDKDIDPLYLLGILNSVVIGDFLLQQISTPLRGGYYSYEKRFIDKLPVKLATDNRKLQKIIISSVSDVISLKKARTKWKHSWRRWSIRIRQKDISLLSMLEEDRKKTQSGKFAETWTRNVTFYPDEDNEVLQTEHGRFKVIGGNSNNTLVIVGQTDSTEEELYRIEFKTKELAYHVFASILILLNSRMKVNNLSDLLSKTEIPVVTPNPIENTPNIIKKVKEEFEKWKTGEKIKGIPSNPISIDNKISDIKAKIDSLVFVLYDLDKNEVTTVMESLSLPSSYQEKVLEFFRKV